MRRGLVLEGGGAKGAYAFGCLLAFREKGIKFDAISGTSVGALNGLLWATGSVHSERGLWEELSRSTVFRISIYPVFFPVLYMLHAHRAMLARIQHPSTSVIVRIFIHPTYSITTIICLLYFLFSISSIEYNETIQIVLFLLFAPLAGTFAALDIFSRQFRDPKIKVVLFLWATILLVTDAIISNDIAASLYILALLLVVIIIYLFSSRGLRLFVYDKAPLARHVRRIAVKELQIPLYVTLSEEREYLDPDRPCWSTLNARRSVSHKLLHERGYFPEYLSLQALDVGARELAVVASAALPLGLTDHVKIGDSKYVDGGMSDNCPIFPLVLWEKCDEVVVIRLSTNTDTEKEKKRLAHIERGVCVSRFRPLPEHTYISRRRFSNKPPITLPYRRSNPPQKIPLRPEKFSSVKILDICPSKNLGGLFRGTLCFSAKKARANIRLGYKDAIAFINDNRL